MVNSLFIGGSYNMMYLLGLEESVLELWNEFNLSDKRISRACVWYTECSLLFGGTTCLAVVCR